jgi:hypothetical protein
MHPNHNLYHGSNLGSTFRDPSPNLVLDSYYPEIDDSGIHSSEGSRLSWDSMQVKVCFSLNISFILTTIYYSAQSFSVFPLKIATQHYNSELSGKLFSTTSS